MVSNKLEGRGIVNWMTLQNRWASLEASVIKQCILLGEKRVNYMWEFMLMIRSSLDLIQRRSSHLNSQ